MGVEVGRRSQAGFQQQFFEAHEHWESAWLRAETDRKDFLQGLIQVAGAMHHARRGNQRGTLSLLRKALPRLRGQMPWAGISVDLVREDVVAWIIVLEASGELSGPPPRIEPRSIAH